MKSELWQVCPICLTSWGEELRATVGEKCGELSKSQKRPCVGRLIPYKEFVVAEWVRPAEYKTDPRSLIRVD